jgi:hypothetical protein
LGFNTANSPFRIKPVKTEAKVCNPRVPENISIVKPNKKEIIKTQLDDIHKGSVKINNM